MTKDSVVLFVAALTMAGGAAWTGRALLTAQPEPEPVVVVEPPSQPVVETVRVLVAAKDLAVGELVDGTALVWREMPAVDASPFAMRASDVKINSLYGAALKQPLGRGAALLPDLLVRPGEPGFLSLVLRPGMRAVSIPTGALQTSFGLVSPGDWVDVVLGVNTARLASSSQEGSHLPSIKAQTIVSRVRILALNNQMAALAKDEGNEKAGRGKQFVTATLAVTPRMAEKLVIARELGELLLSLRPAGEPGVELAQSQRVTTLQEATALFASQPKKEAPLVTGYMGGTTIDQMLPDAY